MTDEQREPQTLEEWQRAADTASALLVLEAVRQPAPDSVVIDRERCEDVLARARVRGIVARANALGQYVAERAALDSPLEPDRDLAGLPPRRGDYLAAQRR